MTKSNLPGWQWSRAKTTAYYSWGRNRSVQHRGIFKPAWTDEFCRFDTLDAPSLAYGLGRSYGDSCLNDDGYLFDTCELNRILSFDIEKGIICCEAGVTLADILQVAVPRGWFLPVTPGTKFVTLAGAIANDVHGKNHHCAGTFGCHITRFALLRSDGTLCICSALENADYYASTIGGLGLTGIILWAELNLRKIASSEISVETLVFRSLQQFLDITAESEERGFEYTVAWIDCLAGKNAKGIFFRGNHAEAGRLSAARTAPGWLRVPFHFPEFALNHYTIKAFNTFYYTAQRLKKSSQNVDYDPFFYPLDSVRDWNLIYGRRGLTQYQCVVPVSESAAFQNILRVISESGEGSFLGVIKKFGSIKSPGMLSFPREGLTLALDFPFRGERTLHLFERLDQIVYDVGGALYPAKDGRMGRKMFESSFPNLERFRAFVDPHLSSSFWRRINKGK